MQKTPNILHLVYFEQSVPFLTICVAWAILEGVGRLVFFGGCGMCVHSLELIPWIKLF